ncbi:hypothetical protein [uncultured Clostridium sp.]|uniref:hypothetical protein n=1 Tax=uncultured Clostridium sp. TaxID=59620 RepID=UPI0026F2E8E2|nr:hypothetical protein [uncultured Clostridium sp.]
MDIKGMDLKVCLDKAVELLGNRDTIRKELDEQGTARAWVNTNSYKLEINIKDRTKEG